MVQGEPWGFHGVFSTVLLEVHSHFSDRWETSCPILVLPWTIISLSDSQDMTVIISSVIIISMQKHTGRYVSHQYNHHSRTPILSTIVWLLLTQYTKCSHQGNHSQRIAHAQQQVLPWLHCSYLGFVRTLLTFNITFRGWHEHWSICCNFLLLPPKETLLFNVLPSRWNNILDNSSASLRLPNLYCWIIWLGIFCHGKFVYQGFAYTV